jgi:DICT domain-containing protein
VPRNGTSVRRRVLARRLRLLREAAGLTLEGAAPELDWSVSKLSRIETAQQAVDVHGVRSMLDLYGAGGEQWTELTALAREANQRGWWRAFGIGDNSYIGFETEAVQVQTFTLAYVPGLLQVPAYSEALFRASPLRRSAADVEREVAVRRIRQERLTAVDGGLRLVTATKRLLVGVSHAVERFALAAGDGPAVVVALFQRLSYFEREAETYRRIAATGALCLVGVVEDVPPTLAPGVRHVVLGEHEPLAREWSVTVLTPSAGATLVAHDTERVTPAAATLEAGREFVGGWSFRRADAHAEVLRLRTALGARLRADTRAAIDEVLARAAPGGGARGRRPGAPRRARRRRGNPRRRAAAPAGRARRHRAGAGRAQRAPQRPLAAALAGWVDQRDRPAGRRAAARPRPGAAAGPLRRAGRDRRRPHRRRGGAGPAPAGRPGGEPGRHHLPRAAARRPGAGAAPVPRRRRRDARAGRAALPVRPAGRERGRHRHPGPAPAGPDARAHRRWAGRPHRPGGAAPVGRGGHPSGQDLDVPGGAAHPDPLPVPDRPEPGARPPP